MIHVNKNKELHHFVHIVCLHSLTYLNSPFLSVSMETYSDSAPTVVTVMLTPSIAGLTRPLTKTPLFPINLATSPAQVSDNT